MGILEKCYTRIRRVAAMSRTRCAFEVPRFIVGMPLIDMTLCTTFLVRNLTGNGFTVHFIPPRMLNISWDSSSQDAASKALPSAHSQQQVNINPLAAAAEAAGAKIIYHTHHGEHQQQDQIHVPAVSSRTVNIPPRSPAPSQKRASSRAFHHHPSPAPSLVSPAWSAAAPAEQRYSNICDTGGCSMLPVNTSEDRSVSMLQYPPFEQQQPQIYNANANASTKNKKDTEKKCFYRSISEFKPSGKFSLRL